MDDAHGKLAATPRPLRASEASAEGVRVAEEREIGFDATPEAGPDGAGIASVPARNLDPAEVCPAPNTARYVDGGGWLAMD
jgi:hypothetical protein